MYAAWAQMLFDDSKVKDDKKVKKDKTELVESDAMVRRVGGSTATSQTPWPGISVRDQAVEPLRDDTGTASPGALTPATG